MPPQSVRCPRRRYDCCIAYPGHHFVLVGDSCKGRRLQCSEEPLLGEPQDRQVRPDFRDGFDFLFLRTNARCGPSPQGPWILTAPGKKVSGISRGFARPTHTVRGKKFPEFWPPPPAWTSGLLLFIFEILDTNPRFGPRPHPRNFSRPPGGLFHLRRAI
jgi:hypothetical protein